MMPGEYSDPDYTLGFRMKYLVVSAVVSAISLPLVIYLGDQFAAVHGPDSSGQIYLGLNYAGLLSSLGFVFSFVTVFAIMALIAFIIIYFRTGQVRLYDDHVEWTKRGNTLNLQYEELTDAYFGYTATPSATPPPGGNQPTYSVQRIVSFYIGNKMFNFNTRRRPGLTSYLEERVPKKNIDVEDDQ